MDIFKMIGDLLSGTKRSPDDKPVDKPAGKPEETPVPDAVEVKARIKKATLGLLDSLYDEVEACRGKRLLVWFDTDETTYGAFAGLRDELTEHWDDERGYVFAAVTLRRGKPETGGRKAVVIPDILDVYLQEELAPVPEKKVAKKAVVSVFGGKGDLLRNEYELSSEELEKDGRDFYNIGRGEFPDVEGGYRQNHIAVDDVKNPEVNGHVSRTHARIGYSEAIGFYLQVEYGGSRLSGNRTRIFRGEEKLDVVSVEVKEPLHHGDLIELGKAVVLQFKEK
jgi:hypothetical protein